MDSLPPTLRAIIHRNVERMMDTADKFCDQCNEWTDHVARDHKRICETCGHNYNRSPYHGMEFTMRGECDECPDCEDRRDAELDTDPPRCRQCGLTVEDSGDHAATYGHHPVR